MTSTNAAYRAGNRTDSPNCCAGKILSQSRERRFAIFYFAINVGAAISQFAMPPIRTLRLRHRLPVPGRPDGRLAFVIFAAGKKHYAARRSAASTTTPEEQAAAPWPSGRILGLFFLVMFFWAIFDQSASTWIFFANACMGCAVRPEVDPDQIQAFNAVFIILLLPLITPVPPCLAAAASRSGRPTR